MVLDKRVRVIVEEYIDKLIEKPTHHEKKFKASLRSQGIEPNLDSILSFINGYLWGVASFYYLLKRERQWNKDEESSLFLLLKRRAWELRQAFINARIEE